MDRTVALARFAPIGETDNEWAFCYLLDRLRKQFRSAPPSRAQLFDAVVRIGGELGERGSFNFLLSDGNVLIARCHTKLSYIVRKQPFSHATLSDADVTVDFTKVTSTRDRVAVIATVPVT